MMNSFLVSPLLSPIVNRIAEIIKGIIFLNNSAVVELVLEVSFSLHSFPLPPPHLLMSLLPSLLL
jgi:hypothetical protein